MASHEEFKKLVAQLDQDLQRARLTAQALGEDLDRVQKAIVELGGHFAPTIAARLQARSPYIGLANGHRLGDEELRNLDEDKYDVILDLRVCTLRYRASPEDHSELEPSDRRHVGKHRLSILERMLRHPGVHFDADKAYGYREERRTADAFAHTISKLREALGQPGLANPYILTLPAPDQCRQVNAAVYTANPAWKYLVIKEREKLMEESL